MKIMVTAGITNPNMMDCPKWACVEISPAMRSHIQRLANFVRDMGADEVTFFFSGFTWDLDYTGEGPTTELHRLVVNRASFYVSSGIAGEYGSFESGFIPISELYSTQEVVVIGDSDSLKKAYKDVILNS